MLPLKNPVEVNISPSRPSVLEEVIEAVKLVEESRESARLQKVLDTDMKTQGTVVTSTLKTIYFMFLSSKFLKGCLQNMRHQQSSVAPKL